MKKKTQATGVVVIRPYAPKAGTGAHKLLWALSRGQETQRQLYNRTHTAGQALGLWREKVMRPLVHGAWVEAVKIYSSAEEDKTLYGLTPAGLRILNALNSIKEVEEFTPVVAAKRERFIPQGVYTGEAPLFTRPGALDFLNCPSRIGNRLIYKENTDVRKTVTLA